MGQHQDLKRNHHDQKNTEEKNILSLEIILGKTIGNHRGKEQCQGSLYQNNAKAVSVPDEIVMRIALAVGHNACKQVTPGFQVKLFKVQIQVKSADKQLCTAFERAQNQRVKRDQDKDRPSAGFPQMREKRCP